MNLTEAQIFEIKNLNLIYVFTTDNIIKNNFEKYIGIKVVYDDDKVFSLDYKSEYFESFIKRILSRYNKEKEKRNIILLGDLTKKIHAKYLQVVTGNADEYPEWIKPIY